MERRHKERSQRDHFGHTLVAFKTIDLLAAVADGTSKFFLRQARAAAQIFQKFAKRGKGGGVGSARGFLRYVHGNSRKTLACGGEQQRDLLLPSRSGKTSQRRCHTMSSLRGAVVLYHNCGRTKKARAPNQHPNPRASTRQAAQTGTLTHYDCDNGNVDDYVDARGKAGTAHCRSRTDGNPSPHPLARVTQGSCTP